ncbi:YtxH domain-containing protein [Sutcliffiella halmapala]|uniref:YtxH domain-containing protein n=1 Tax=Sutcliffiella halmapala TaxID=79882 RepID=UPI000995AABA|nr:YtxH domain-containing protein [Sutcliffiella halmapala]
MEKRNKMFEGMLIGALVGAAISLLDKETRTNFIHNGKQVGGKIKYVVQHPQEITDAVRQQIQNVKTTVDDVSRDMDYLRVKINELRETTPQVLEIVQDTKEVITKHLEPNKNK